jgi:hypothetical protein
MGFWGLCDKVPFRAQEQFKYTIFKQHKESRFSKTDPQNQKAQLSHPYNKLTKRTQWVRVST